MSKRNSFEIAVIGHEKVDAILPNGFRYLTREVDFELRQKIDNTIKFRSTGLAWSEYAAIFENYDFSENAPEITGLYHYRCALNLSNSPLNTLPMFFRRTILRRQIRVISEIGDRIFVGAPRQFPESLLANFLHAHPDFFQILLSACKIYDEVNNNEEGFAIELLASETRLITRNIYISPKEFSDRWVNQAFYIARELDRLFPEPKSDRWGGYVLERLFSIYITQEIERKNYSVEFYPHLYFASTKMWLRIASANARTGIVKLLKFVKKFF